MRRTTYRTTVAAIALLAGAGFASAQRGDGPAQKNEAPSPAPQSQQQAPAEKMAPPGRALDKDKGTQMKPSAPATTGQAQPKGDDAKKSEQPKGSTTGQAPPKSDAPQPGAQPKGSAQQPSTQPKGPDTAQQPGVRPKSSAQQPGAQPAPTTGQATAPASAAVNLTADQKTQIRTTVLTANAPRATNVNFSVGVGTVVPQTVKLVAVPDVLIRIHPAWRGYMYFVVRDEIIVVEPRTLKIVAVLVV
jgi:hypothetical protein